MSIFAEEIIPLGWEIPRPAPSNGGLFLYGSHEGKAKGNRLY